MFGSQGTYVAFPLLALALFPPAQAALVTAASYGSTLLVGLPAGVLADRGSRRRLMVIAELVQMLAMIALVLALWLDAATLLVVCAISFVNGAMHVLFGAASSSSIPDLIERKQLASALSANEARNATLSIAGPLVGAALFAVHQAAPFGLAALTFAVSFVLLLVIKNELKPDAQEDAKRRPVRIRDGLSTILGKPVLRGIIAAQVVLSFVLTASFFTTLALLSDQGDLVGAGMVTALIGVGLLAGSALAPRLAPRLTPSLAITAQAVLWALALLILAAWPGLTAAAVAMALMWLFVPTARVVVETWVADHIPTGTRGRIQSVRSLANATASPLGPVVCGLLIAAIDYRGTLAILVGLALLAALISTVSQRAAR